MGAFCVVLVRETPAHHVSTIYLGKNIPDSKIEKLVDVDKILGVHVCLQTSAHNREYSLTLGFRPFIRTLITLPL